MGGKRVASTREAATQLLPALAPEDQVALAGFDHRYWGVVAFTTDREADPARRWTTIKPFGSTALHDALDHAARDLATWGEGRRAVVVLTDGVDTSSQLPADEVLARSQALDVPIYAVSRRLAARRPELAVVHWARATRGRDRRRRDARPLREPLRRGRFTRERRSAGCVRAAAHASSAS